MKDINVQFALLLNRIRNCNKEGIQSLALFTSSWPFLVPYIFMFLSFSISSLASFVLFFLIPPRNVPNINDIPQTFVCLSVYLSVLLENKLRTEESQELEITDHLVDMERNKVIGRIEIIK